MMKYLKKQWLRLKQSWNAFKREWLFNGVDRSDHLVASRPFWIMGLGRLKDPGSYPDSSFDMLPPYYGQALTRMNGHVFTLKHNHHNPETGVVRYFDTDKPEKGFVILTVEMLDLPEPPK